MHIVTTIVRWALHKLSHFESAILAHPDRDLDLFVTNRQLAEEDTPVLEIRDVFGHTPLHYAANWGGVENIRLLLAAGGPSSDSLVWQCQKPTPDSGESTRAVASQPIPQP